MGFMLCLHVQNFWKLNPFFEAEPEFMNEVLQAEKKCTKPMKTVLPQMKNTSKQKSLTLEHPNYIRAHGQTQFADRFHGSLN